MQQQLLRTAVLFIPINTAIPRRFLRDTLTLLYNNRQFVFVRRRLRLKNMPDDDFRQVLLKISTREGLVDPEFKSDSLNDTGYVGDVCTIDIFSESGTLSLFFKRAEYNPALQEQVLKYLFAAEINFYKNVVPELTKLFGAQSSIPKCYYTYEDKLLVLENLYARNFKLWPDLKVELDEEHVKLVFEEYGRYHAMSHALKQRDPEKFEKLLGKVDVFSNAYKRYESTGLFKSIGDKALAGFGEELKECRLVFDRFVNEEAHGFLKGFDEDDLYDVAVHGDCWTHNYMFKYQGTKPVQVCLLDFQLTRRASPIVDLSYFLCTSACSKLHFDNLPKYLQIYSDSASTFLKENGFTCENALIGEELQAKWRKYGRYGLLWGMVVMKMMVADKDEIEKVDKQQGLFASFDFVSRNEELYVRKMREAILYFYQNDMF